MKQGIKRLTMFVLCAALLLGCLPSVQAAQTKQTAATGGSFYFTAMTVNQTIAQPEPIAYAEGQSVRQALAASGHRFEGLEDGMITGIDGVSGNFNRYYDGGGYDLDVPAAEITALLFCVNEVYSDSMIELICAMGRYNEADDHVQQDPAAQTAYNTALKQMRTADADTAKSLLEQLNAAVDAYRGRMNGPKYTITFSVTQANASFSGAEITMTDACKNVTTGTGSVSVVEGTYTYSVSDGGDNRTQGTLTVSGNTTVKVNLPSGSWFGDVKLLNVDKQAFDAEQSGNHVTWYVDDTAGATGLYLNAAQGSVPSRDNTKLYAMYTDNAGLDHSGSFCSWESTTVSLSNLLQYGMKGRDFTLEARYQESGVTYIQSVSITIIRVATLKSLRVLDKDTQLFLPFNPTQTVYRMTAACDTLTVDATAFTSDGTTVTINNGTDPQVPLTDGANAISIQVSNAAGRNRTYQLQVQKVNPVAVKVHIPDGVSAVIQNEAGITLQATGTTYQLVPGQSYTCVSTKDTWYHAAMEFTAAEGQTITAPVPQTTDQLTDLAFYDKSSSSTRKKFAFDQDFTGSNHSYTSVVSDTASAAYVQGTASSAYSVTATYLTQSSDAESCGLNKTVTVKYKVSPTGSTSYLGSCLSRSGYAQTLTITVSMSQNEVTQYQDYEIVFARQAHLLEFACAVDGMDKDLTDENHIPVSFNRNTTEYYLQVLSDAKTLTCSGLFPSEGSGTSISGGYYATTDAVDYTELSAIRVDLTGAYTTKDVVITSHHEDKNSVATNYTLHITKVSPIRVQMKTTPADAVSFFTNNASGDPVYAKDGAFELIPGASYTYTVTCNGYVGTNVTDFIAPQQSGTVQVTLQKAPENPSLQEFTAQWPSFRQSGDNNGVTNTPIATTAEDATLYWATKIGTGYSADACGCPILVDGYLYVYAGAKLYKVDTASGKIIASGDMDHASSFSITNATYGAGMIFVGLNDGTVQAFNAATLESVWIYRDPLGGQPNCPIAYRNGYVYTGFWQGEELDGRFVCLSVGDENPQSTKEEKLATWSYTIKGGFYWAGAYVSDDFLLIGTDDGKLGYQTGYASLVSLNPRTGTILSEMKMPDPGDIRSSITYDSSTGEYYFTSKGGYFYGVKMNEDGTIRENTLRSIRLQNGSDALAMSTSTPTVYNGRAYIGVCGTSQFGQYSGHNITVLDLKNWEIAYRVQTQGYPQTSGMLTTAYDKGNGTVYVYFLDNYIPGKIRVIEDKPGQSEPMMTQTETNQGVSYEVAPSLLTPDGAQAQYAICSPIVDEDGTIYFKNDSGYLMAIGSTPERIELVKKPDKLSYTAGETFDPTGMQVIATYKNGTQRDVTKAMQWNTDPLQVTDTEFELFLPMLYQNRDGKIGQKVENLMQMLPITIAAQTDPEWQNPFTDVAQGKWYYEAVRYAVTNHLFNGNSPTVFLPDADMTRAMLVTVLWRMAGEPQSAGENGFTDVQNGKWYTTAITWAAENKIVNGIKANIYQPDQPVTREQMAAILYRYAGQYLKQDVSAQAELTAFPDAAQVSAYAKEAICWAVSKELINGSGGKLLPKGNATRAQVAAILMRFEKNIAASSAVQPSEQLGQTLPQEISSQQDQAQALQEENTEMTDASKDFQAS